MIAIKALRFIHLLITLFAAAAFALPWSGAWVITLFFIPLMILHWKTNQGSCVLTNLEHRWMAAKGLSSPKRENEGEFTRRLLKPLLGQRELTRGQLQRIVYAAITFNWMVCAVRLWMESR